MRAATQCRNWVQAMFHAVDRIGLKSFADVIRLGDACDAIDLVRRALVGG